MCTIGIQIRKSSKTVLLKNVWTLTTYMSWLKSTIFTIVLSLRNSLFTYLRWTMTKLQLHCSTVIAGVGPKPNFSTGSPPIMWFLIKMLLLAVATTFTKKIHCKYLWPNYDGITVYHRTSTIFRCNVPLHLNIPIAKDRYPKIYCDMIVKCQ